MEIQEYNIPDDLYYEEHHFWAKEEGALVVMGLDDFGQKMAGEIVYVQLPDEGRKLKQGKKFAGMESGKWLGKIYAPVSGELVEVNEDLETNPGLINEDCYGKGWMYKIRPDDMSELNDLIHGVEAVEKWVLESIEKYKKD
jgi:glycine cleavage system H protein